VKLRISLLAVAILLLSTATASAFHWHLGYGQAKHATKEFAQTLCEEDRECVGWGVGQCNRRSESRIDCTMGVFYAGAEPGTEIECDGVLHWGVDRAGYVALKNAGPPHCHPR
jgi:hypothetical protein